MPEVPLRKLSGLNIVWVGFHEEGRVAPPHMGPAMQRRRASCY